MKEHTKHDRHVKKNPAAGQRPEMGDAGGDSGWADNPGATPGERTASRLLLEQGEDSAKRFVNGIVRGKEFEVFVTNPQALARPAAKGSEAQWRNSLPVAVLSKQQAGKASQLLLMKQGVAYKQSKSRAGAIAKGKFGVGDYANLQGVLDGIKLIHEGKRIEGWGTAGGKNYFLAWENENGRSMLVTFHPLSSNPAKLRRKVRSLKRKKR